MGGTGGESHSCTAAGHPSCVWGQHEVSVSQVGGSQSLFGGWQGCEGLLEAVGSAGVGRGDRVLWVPIAVWQRGLGGALATPKTSAFVLIMVIFSSKNTLLLNVRSLFPLLFP